jgi:RNA polymerase sigma-70 factor (ECF subfamily)
MKLAVPSRSSATPEDNQITNVIESRAAAAAAGDTDALGDLFETFHDATYRYVFAQVRNQHLAEDLNGKAWLKIVHRIGSYQRQSGAGFPNWAYTIVKNTITDEYRSAHHRRETPSADMLAIGGPGLVSQSATPEESVLDVERVQGLREDVVKALECLSKNQRAAVVHRFWGGLDVPTVASVMQMTPANVRNLQSRGMKRLQTLLPDREALAMALNTAQEKVNANAPQVPATH